MNMLDGCTIQDWGRTGEQRMEKRHPRLPPPSFYCVLFVSLGSSYQLNFDKLQFRHVRIYCSISYITFLQTSYKQYIKGNTTKILLMKSLNKQNKSIRGTKIYEKTILRKSMKIIQTWACLLSFLAQQAQLVAYLTVSSRISLWHFWNSNKTATI